MIWKKKCSLATAPYSTFKWHLTLKKPPRIWHSKSAIPALPSTRTLEKHTCFCFSFKLLISYHVPSFINPRLPWENPHNMRKVLYPTSVPLLSWRCPGENRICWKLKLNANGVLCMLFRTVQMLYKYNSIATFTALLNYESWATQWALLHVALPSAKITICSHTGRKPLENISRTDFPVGSWGTSPLLNPFLGMIREDFFFPLAPLSSLPALPQVRASGSFKTSQTSLTHRSPDQHAQSGRVTSSCLKWWRLLWALYKWAWGAREEGGSAMTGRAQVRSQATSTPLPVFICFSFLPLSSCCNTSVCSHKTTHRLWLSGSSKKKVLS